MLYRNVPSLSVASCGMMDSWLRRSCSPISLMGTPSMEMEPSVASRMRKRASVRELLPAPVLEEEEIMSLSQHRGEETRSKRRRLTVRRRQSSLPARS